MKGFLKSKLILTMVTLVMILAAIALAFSGHIPQSRATSPVLSSSRVGPTQYYLALGDSLTFGFQPNGDFTHGFVTDLFRDLQQEGVVEAVANLGCNGAGSSGFISFRVSSPGDCGAQHPRFPYAGTQLNAALAFLRAHAGKVPLVTFEIGLNDLEPSMNFNPQTKTCAVDVAAFHTALQTLDTNLRHTILPQLHAALTVNGHSTGVLAVLNYYDPFQNFCPQTVRYFQIANAHLAADVNHFGIIIDVFDAFGGAKVPNPTLCVYTWACAPNVPGNDHPTTSGYQVIANAIEAALQNIVQSKGSKPLTV
jgi:lysophospholipase L1-like esterase